MAIHCRLSAILGERRIKQIEVTRRTGLAKATVSSLYHDRVRKVDYEILDKLCRFLNCQPGDLLIYTPDEKQAKAKGE